MRVDGWPRVNQVDGDLLKLVERPALAYRNRRVLDIAAADLSKIEIHREGEDFTFEKKDGAWKLTAPATADLDAAKVSLLAGEFAKLEGGEFVADQPKQEELDKTYGLAKAKLTVKLFFKDAKKTLMLGNKRDAKQDYYARIDQGPVFTVKKDLHDDLDRSSLSYRPLQIWKLDPEAITEIDVQGAKSTYQLKQEKLDWKITKPFSAAASGLQIEQIADRLAQLKAEKYAAHQTKDLASFGLDKPVLTIRLSVKDGKPVTLEIGKLVDKDSTNRYARQTGSDAIFVISEKAYAGLDRDALDWLDKTLLTLNPRTIERVRFQGGAAPFTLEPMKEQWQVVGSPAPTFTGDEATIDDTLRAWQNLLAEKYIAYGPKIDWAKYGLDKPGATITVTLKTDAKANNLTEEHVLELGGASNGGRYARIDKKEAVVLLDGKTAQNLAKSELSYDFVDPRVLKFDVPSLNSIERQMPGADLALSKREDNWVLTKPAMRDADIRTVDELIDRTFRLRAKRVAAYPAKDLQPFGLDKPAAVVTLSLENSKHVIKVGNLTKDAARKETDERYAIIDNQPTVVVLARELSRQFRRRRCSFSPIAMSPVFPTSITRGK